MALANLISELARRRRAREIGGNMTAENAAPFMRLFIAVAVSPGVRQEIGRAQSRLQRGMPPGAVRWTPPDQFHITLKFLGDVPAEHLAALQQSLAAICAAFHLLRLSAHGLGFFPNASRPRIIWAGASDSQSRMPELHRHIDEALCWLAPPERPEKFAGHITLGRFKPGSHAAIPKLLELIADVRDRHFGEWPAGEVQLVRSELTSIRAEHSVIARFPLKT